MALTVQDPGADEQHGGPSRYSLTSPSWSTSSSRRLRCSTHHQSSGALACVGCGAHPASPLQAALPCSTHACSLCMIAHAVPRPLL
eukprot:1133466-Pelagomonas_calceolata.AAC.1